MYFQKNMFMVHIPLQKHSQDFGETVKLFKITDRQYVSM